jgi:hypothetical protein
MRYNQWIFGRNWCVIKGGLLVNRSFSSPSRFPFKQGDQNVISGIPYACAASSVSLVKICR